MADTSKTPPTGAGYAGDIDAKRAWDILQSDPAAALIDVRTPPEWEFSGAPILAGLGKEPVFVPWQVYPRMELNPDFVGAVAATGVDAAAPLLFLCRSGARSRAAAIAMTTAGYRTCYNVGGGFEGPRDAEGHRATVDGWKFYGLPWIQG